jgi:hypothetical protein
MAPGHTGTLLKIQPKESLHKWETLVPKESAPALLPRDRHHIPTPVRRRKWLSLEQSLAVGPVLIAHTAPGPLTHDLLHLLSARSQPVRGPWEVSPQTGGLPTLHAPAPLHPPPLPSQDFPLRQQKARSSLRKQRATMHKYYNLGNLRRLTVLAKTLVPAPSHCQDRQRSDPHHIRASRELRSSLHH